MNEPFNSIETHGTSNVKILNDWCDFQGLSKCILPRNSVAAIEFRRSCVVYLTVVQYVRFFLSCPFCDTECPKLSTRHTSKFPVVHRCPNLFLVEIVSFIPRTAASRRVVVMFLFDTIAERNRTEQL